MKRSIEIDFPFEKIDHIAELESYRKEINRPIYHIHKWWAKRLGSVFRSVVSGSLSEGKWNDFFSTQEFTGKVVLDPFMGSGTTLGETLKLGAKAIGCDINPVSTFLVKQALTSVDLESLQSEYLRVENDVKEKISYYYRTKLEGELFPSQALYYFWVKVVVTPSGEELPLFSSYVFSKNAYTKKKPMAQILCPACGNILEGRYDSTNEECSVCNNSFNPQLGPAKGQYVIDSLGEKHSIKSLVQLSSRPPSHKLYAIMSLNAKGEKIYSKPTSFDYSLLEEAKNELEEIEATLPLPKMAVRAGHNTNQARGYNYTHWRDFFNERQLLTLGILLKRIIAVEDENIREQLICLFSGTLEFNNLFCSFKGEGTGAVRHMFSNHILKPERTPLENCVWGIDGKSSGTFSSLFKSRLLKAKQYLKVPFEIYVEEKEGRKISTKKVFSRPIDVTVTDNWKDFSQGQQRALVLNGDSGNLPLPDASVDAIVTDPPYFDFVHYSELSDFFYAWLSVALGSKYHYMRKIDSSDKNEVQDKSEDSFSLKISRIFRESKRVLKNDGTLSFSYHHSNTQGWLAIYRAIQSAGLYLTAAHPVKAEMSVASPKSKSKSPINIDAILVCKKDNHESQEFMERGCLLSKVRDYESRFSDIGRTLSSGDIFVICCSQALVYASSKQMTEEEAANLIDWLVEKVGPVKKQTLEVIS